MALRLLYSFFFVLEKVFVCGGRVTSFTFESKHRGVHEALPTVLASFCTMINFISCMERLALRGTKKLMFDKKNRNNGPSRVTGLAVLSTNDVCATCSLGDADCSCQHWASVADAAAS